MGKDTYQSFVDSLIQNGVATVIDSDLVITQSGGFGFRHLSSVAYIYSWPVEKLCSEYLKHCGCTRMGDLDFDVAVVCFLSDIYPDLQPLEFVKVMIKSGHERSMVDRQFLITLLGSAGMLNSNVYPTEAGLYLWELIKTDTLPNPITGSSICWLGRLINGIFWVYRNQANAIVPSLWDELWSLLPVDSEPLSLLEEEFKWHKMSDKNYPLAVDHRNNVDSDPFIYNYDHPFRTYADAPSEEAGTEKDRWRYEGWLACAESPGQFYMVANAVLKHLDDSVFALAIMKLGELAWGDSEIPRTYERENRRFEKHLFHLLQIPFYAEAEEFLTRICKRLDPADREEALNLLAIVQEQQLWNDRVRNELIQKRL